MRTAPFLIGAVHTALFAKSTNDRGGGGVVGTISSRASASSGSIILPIVAPSLLPPVTDTCRARIYLLRHGETDWNAKGLMQGGGFDIELNDKGRQQALAVVAGENAALVGDTSTSILPPPISVVVSSHLKRASQTADILHQQLFPTAKRIVKSEFAEMSFGTFEGLAIRGPDATPEILEQFRNFNDSMKKDADKHWPGGESTRDVAIRAQRGLNQILDEFAPNINTTTSIPDSGSRPPHIAIVAHGRTNKIILASLLTRDVLQYGAYQQGNTCINVVDLDVDGTWTARTLNYMNHIQGDLARAE